MTKYKPLTPSFRQEINIGFDNQIAELKTCKPSALVNMQIEALRMYKRLIAGLPDGYHMPLAERKRGRMKLIDADKLEPDTEWNDYYDGYVSYSQSQIDDAEEIKAIPLERLKDFRNQVMNMNSIAIIQRLDKLIEEVEG